MPHLTGLSFAYPDVPAFERAPLVDPEPWADSVTEIFLLSTCLRVELVWGGGPDMAPDVLRHLYGSRSLPEPRIRTGQQAFHHLARIAAGLDSVPVGETEVLTQFRQAVKRFQQDSPEGNGLSTVLTAAIGVGRSARRVLETEAAGSLAVAAAEMAGSASRVVVLGSGAMARAVIAELGDAEVALYARRPGTTAGIPIRPWAEAAHALVSAPVVVSTVPGPVFGPDTLADRHASTLFVDLGMPPAFDSKEPADHLEYHNVDDVAARVRSGPAAEAEEVATAEAAAAWRRLAVSDRAGSIITSVVDRAERAADEEVHRFVSRLTTASDPEKVLRQLARTVARRILHPSVSYVGSTPLGQSELDMIARALGVDRD
jgi:glutamyl-tRNA reductase